MKRLTVPAPISSVPYAGYGSASADFDANLPPLGGTPEIGPSAVNLRWLGACLLIAVSGGGLVGAAFYGAAETRSAIVTPPQSMVVRPAPGEQDSEEVVQRGDKLAQGTAGVSPAAAKQEFEAPATERVGNREVIKIRPYVRLVTDLSLSDVGVEKIPRFDPARFMMDDGTQPPPEDVPADYDPADTEATIEKSDLTGLAVNADEPALSDDEAMRQIKELSSLTPDPGRLPVGFTDQRILARTFRFRDSEQDPSNEGMAEPGVSTPFDTINVRIMPENMVSIPKNRASSASPLYENRDITLSHGETLEIALRRNGATQARADKIMSALSPAARSGLADGQHVRLLLGPENDGRPIEKVTLYSEDGTQESVAANDRGSFVSVVQPPSPPKETASAKPTGDNGHGVSLYESVYKTALDNGIPQPVIDSVIRAFAYGVDFQQPAVAGDRLYIFYGNDDPDQPELLYAAIKSGDEIRRIYRYRSASTGNVDYFDQEGHSLKKFLMRKPVADGRISSPFGARLHPILGYTRRHNGVDWAAPRGTPIMATGDGIVEAAGVRSGYGNRVEIKHANGYATAYNHMAQIGRGIVPGTHVRLGQVIGYVGTTGLSTGPHVHYEVTINGEFVDPMKIRLPDGEELTGDALASFEQDEKQIDNLRHHG